MRKIADNCGAWHGNLASLCNNKAGPVSENISGGVAGITVGVDVIQGSEVADRD